MALSQQELNALQWLESLLCNDLVPVTEERVFAPRSGYKTVFTGIFTEVNSVQVNGEDVDYYPAFFDKRNGDYFNSIVLAKEVSGDVTINAKWGFATLPADLQRLVDNATKTLTAKYVSKDVKSKRVRNFTISYGDLSDDEVFMKNNATTIAKYSLCGIGQVRHGCSHGRRDCECV